jgi:regulatory protein
MVDEKAYQQAIKYLSYRARTSKQIVDYLCKKGHSESVISSIISQLISRRWIDDKEYAMRFAEQSIFKKHKGQIWIKQMLLRKGIDVVIIQDVLENVDNQLVIDEAIAFASKKLSSSSIQKGNTVQKLYQSLMRRGYNHEVIHQVFNTIKIEIP